jgi:hypothetical protein
MILAAQLLARFGEKGVRVVLAPEGKVRCTPRKKLSEDDISALRVHKAEIVSILSGEDITPSPPSPPPTKPLRNGLFSGDDHGDDPPTETVTTVTSGATVTGEATVAEPTFVKKDRERRQSEAEKLGLVAQWSPEAFGFISLHDPTTGEWHDLKTEDAPPWAKNEAFKRKDLYKSGNRRAYRLSAREMERLWEEEHDVPDPEGIVEDYPVEEDA